jgi:hypothetical protein
MRLRSLQTFADHIDQIDKARIDAFNTALVAPVAFGRKVDDEAQCCELSRLKNEHATRLHVFALAGSLIFIGYFRLRGYALPLMRLEPDGGRVFNCGTSFLDILARYELDRDLGRVTLGQSQDP